MRRFSPILLILLAATAHGDDMPQWVADPIVPAGYLAAVSSAEITSSQSAAEHEAFTSAVAILAAQLQVDVEGTMRQRRSETVGSAGAAAWRHDFESDVQTVSSVRLEGVEIVDRYIRDQRLWVFVRIDEVALQMRWQQRVEQQRDRLRLHLDILENSQSSEAMALRSGTHAWAILSAPMPAGWSWEDWGAMRQQVLAALCQRLARIELRPYRGTGTLSVDVRHLADSVALSGLPLRLRVGETSRLLWTNDEGRVSATMASLGATATIHVRLDLQALIGQPVDADDLPLPTTRVELTHQPRRLVLTGSERYFGEAGDLHHLRPIIGTALRQAGARIVEERFDAQQIVEIDANAYRGTRVGELAFAWLDLSVTVYDARTQAVLFHGIRNEIKGAGLDSDDAIAAAMQQATGLIREAVSSYHRDMAMLDSMGTSLHP